MSHVYVTSDWHLGHSGIASRFRTNFGSDSHHDYTIVENAAEILTKRDTILMLGDMAFTVEGLEMIDKLPGRKILIRGNHDILKQAQYNEVFDEIHGAYRYKGAFWTHIPIHPMELFRGFNVHGHCHRGGPSQVRDGEDWHLYYNAILEFNDYRPVDVRQVYSRLRTQAEIKRMEDPDYVP